MLNIATMQLAADHQNRLRRRADDRRALGEAAAWRTNGLRRPAGGAPEVPGCGGVAGPRDVPPPTRTSRVQAPEDRKIEATS